MTVTWINFRKDICFSYIPIEPEKKYDLAANAFFNINSLGVGTRRDAWAYGAEKKMVFKNMMSTINFYNQQVEEYIMQKESNPYLTVDDFMCKDCTRISWSSSLIPKLKNGITCKFDQNKFFSAYYRPFYKQNLYYGELFIHRRGNWDKIICDDKCNNIVICVSGVGITKLSCIVTQLICDEELIGEVPRHANAQGSTAQRVMWRQEAFAAVALVDVAHGDIEASALEEHTGIDVHNRIVSDFDV